MKRLIYFLPFLAALSLSACSNDCDDCNFEPVNPVHNRVLFHYLAMDNNLSSFGRQNVTDMLAGATKENLNGGAIVVFSDMPSTNSSLLYIRANRAGETQMDTLYKWDSNLDSSNPATFTTAFEKARELVRTNAWALGGGSHGSGWMPAALHSRYLTSSRVLRSLTEEQEQSQEQPWYIRDPYREPVTRALFNDDGIVRSYMEIDQFVAAIPDNTFDFAIMDICYMGGIEFAYAMRNKVKQLVLSPAEVLGYGMPYDRIIQYIFADTPSLGAGGVCEAYYNYYLNDFPSRPEEKGNAFATIALYDCTKLSDFANTMRDIVGPMESQISTLTSSYLNTDVIKIFDRNYRHTIFDFREFIYYLYPENESIRATFDVALNSVVTYKRTTGKYLDYSFYIPEERYCGMSTYIPISEYSDLNTYYWQTEWAQTVFQQ